jgi:osmoprotectant transport system ATP-binding protein
MTTTSSDANAVIEFAHAEYRLNAARTLVSDLNLTIHRSEMLILLGRSGSGKTTTLKLINRLLVPTAGEVRVNGIPTVAWDAVRLRRGIGYAIQEVGLFPHYTVEQNLGLLPSIEGWPKDRIAARVTELLDLVGLSAQDYSSRYPDQLSGGQRQRVGLARALAADPPILLMDEPFGALDPVTRFEIQQEFRDLQQRLNKTVVFVTHDVTEAVLLGNRIAVIDSGELRGTWTPREFLASNSPHLQPYVAAFEAARRLFQQL